MGKPLLPAQFRFEVPPFGETDPRPEATLRLLEGFFPGVRIDQEIQHDPDPDSTKPPRLVPVRGRASWLADKQRSASSVLITSGEEDPAITVAFGFGERTQAADGGTMTSATVWVPGEEPSEPGWPERMGQCGDALNAWHLAYMPVNVFLPVFQHPRRPRPPPKGSGLDLSGLPRLTPGVVPTVELPIQIGWLNYWSRRTAELLGFPDASRDAEWLAHAVQTPAGAWVVPITPEPFDGSRQDHVDALARAYRRFDRIGVRW